MQKMITILYLVVILEPYIDIDYSTSNLYDFTSPETKEPQQKPKKIEMIWCSFCNPAQWLTIEE